MNNTRFADIGKTALMPQNLIWLLPSLGLVLAVISLFDLAETHDLASIWSLIHQENTRSLLLTQSWAPRFLIALVAGGGLGVAGMLFQHTLKNPLAAPSTLGLAGGAKLFLTLVTLYAPQMLLIGQDTIAFFGCISVGALVFIVARHSNFSPLIVILTGMVIALYCGAVTTSLSILNHEWLSSLFIWGSGDLSQDGWYILGPMTVKIMPCIVIALLIARPLEMLSLNEHQATALGASPARLRMLCLLIGCAITAIIVSAVGIIGFIGLAAPAIARLANARRLRSKLVWSGFAGAALLFCADQAVQVVSGITGTLVPVGALSGVLGAPLLIMLVRKLHGISLKPATPSKGYGLSAAKPGTSRSGKLTILMLSALIIATTIFVGRDVYGTWDIQSFDQLSAIWPWRGPRILGSIAAGAMLAVAGTILQRMTANPMASPESLGVSAGAAAGMIVILFATGTPSHELQLIAAAGGGILTLVAIFALTRRSGFSPERILIAGIALGAVFDGLIGYLMAGGDPRAMRLLTWSSGSTYGLDFNRAGLLALVAVGILPILPALARWLDLFPLGSTTTRNLGVDLFRARGVLLLIAAILCAAATLLVGPLSFAGLIGPHLARLFGFRRALAHGYGAAMIGAILMGGADWVGRMVFFPWELPTGLMAAIISGPILVWLLLRVQRTYP